MPWQDSNVELLFNVAQCLKSNNLREQIAEHTKMIGKKLYQLDDWSDIRSFSYKRKTYIHLPTIIFRVTPHALVDTQTLDIWQLWDTDGKKSEVKKESVGHLKKTSGEWRGVEICLGAR